MKKIIYILLLCFSSPTFSVCGLEVGEETIQRYFDDRNGELIYTCENAIQYDRAYRVSDICVYKSQEVPVYIEEFMKHHDKNIDGYFTASKLNRNYEPAVYKKTTTGMVIKSDEQNFMGVGTLVEFSIEGTRGHYTIKSKDYLESLVDILFERTNIKRWHFNCKKVETQKKSIKMMPL